MMNALFGVLGAASCRFFDPAIAERDHRLRPADPALDARRVRGRGRAPCSTATPTRCSCSSARGERRRGRDAARPRVESAIAERDPRDLRRRRRSSSSSSSASSSASSCRACAAAARAARSAMRAGSDGRLEVVGLEVGAPRLARGRAPAPARACSSALFTGRDPCCRSCARSWSRLRARRARRRARLREARPQGRARALHRRHAAARAGRAQGGRARRAGVVRYVITARGPGAGAARPRAAARHRPLALRRDACCARSPTRSSSGSAAALRRGARRAAPARAAVVG